jgi:excisionase family DNA binding protein
VHESADQSSHSGVISPDDVLTAEEVAAILRMTRAWVYSETRQNRIPHMRFGRRFRYRRSTIMAWLAAHENGQRPSSRPVVPRIESINGAKDQKVIAYARIARVESAKRTPRQQGLF